MNTDHGLTPSKESHALHILLASLIDFAGLFPPSSLAMKESVSHFARFRYSEFSWILGRFILPAERLAEFESELPIVRKGAGWHLSALVGPDIKNDLQTVAAFNRCHSGTAQVDSIETRISSPSQVAEIRQQLPDGLLTYFEVPADADPRPFVAAIRAARARAKLRTGGVKQDMFPNAEQIARFLYACIEIGVPFKATAGLHHPVRCVRPLTYAADAPTGTMHGFLNIFLAAAFALAGMPEPQLLELLQETSPGAFKFDPNGANWREQRLDNTHLLECRAGLGMSFGSCSVDEPIEDLRSINLL